MNSMHMHMSIRVSLVFSCLYGECQCRCLRLLSIWFCVRVLRLRRLSSLALAMAHMKYLYAHAYA